MFWDFSFGSIIFVDSLVLIYRVLMMSINYLRSLEGGGFLRAKSLLILAWGESTKNIYLFSFNLSDFNLILNASLNLL